MSKNIDELTSMVQKVTLVTEKQQEQETKGEEAINGNNKRTKMQAPEKAAPATPDETLSKEDEPDLISSGMMDVDDLLPPSIPSPMAVDRTSSHTASEASELSDDGFVDQLFTAFKTEEFDFDETESFPGHKEANRPRPELMNRLSEALATLPKDIQEMIVERLIQSITAPKEIQENIKAANCMKETMVASKGGGKALPSSMTPPRSPKKEVEQPQQPMPLPLAAATLAALLAQYGDSSKPMASKDHKALLIPVSA